MTPALQTVSTAIPIGIAFGVILERAGLGDSRVIEGQLVGRDFTVVRVMFGAIVTAMLGVMWADVTGWMQLGAIAVPPTDAMAQMVGAIVFGAGFALAALCPGTACVAAASGKRDGIATVGGVLLGTLLTPFAWSMVGVVAADTPREGARLDIDLGIPLSAAVAGVVVLGVLASVVARRVEHRGGGAPWWHLRSIEVVALTLGFSFIVVDWSRSGDLNPGTLAALAGEIEREEDHVDALELATWIRERRAGLRIVDVRELVDSADYTIPGAELLPVSRVGELKPAPGDTVVLYSDGGAHAAQAWVLLRARGVKGVLVLKDGLAAWDDEVLSPRFPAVRDDSAQRRFARARELAYWFGGRPRLIDPSVNARQTVVRPRRKRKTC